MAEVVREGEKHLWRSASFFAKYIMTEMLKGCDQL
ncbi:hypothetical protein ABMB67_002434 [Halalkalibacter oceani]